MDRRHGAAVTALVAALAIGAAADKAISRGTLVRVVLDTALSTKTNKAGDTFTLHCAGEDCGGFPYGTKFHGVLTAVRSKTDKLPGSADVTITRAELPHGKSIAITALPSDEKGKTRGTVAGRTAREKREKKGLLMGAAGGLLLGPIGGIAGHVGSKQLHHKPDNIEAKPGKKGYIKIMEPITLPQ